MELTGVFYRHVYFGNATLKLVDALVGAFVDTSIDAFVGVVVDASVDDYLLLHRSKFPSANSFCLLFS